MTAVVLALFALAVPGSQKSPSAIYQQAKSAIVTVRTKAGTGTGFVIGKGQHVVTCEHVMQGESKAVVQDQVGNVIFSDKETDLAILKVPKAFPNILPVATSIPKVGTKIYVIGTPLGVLEKTLSEGLVSGIRSIDGVDLLQISAAVSEGSSGSPVINGNGQVVGVVTSTISEGQSLNFASSSMHVFRAWQGIQSGVPPVKAASKPKTDPSVVELQRLMDKALSDDKDAKEAGDEFVRQADKSLPYLYSVLALPDEDHHCQTTNLMDLFGPEQKPYVMKALRSNNLGLREAVICGLTWMSDGETLKKGGHPWLKDADVQKLIVEQLREDDLCEGAFQAVENHSISSATAEVLAAVLRLDTITAVTGVRTLAAICPDGQEDVLVRAYDSMVERISEEVEDPEYQARRVQPVIEAIASGKSSSALKFLVKIMDSDDPTTRLLVCDALGNRGDKAAIPALDSVTNDVQMEVKMASLAALIKLGSEAHSSKALDLLKSLRDANQQKYLLYAFRGRLEWPNVLDTVLSYVDDKSTSVRERVAMMLGSSKSEKALAALNKLTSDPEPSVRTAAKESLALRKEQADGG